MASYTDTIAAIKEVCAKINIAYSKDGDGRITSAVKEKEYLDLLEKGLKEKMPSVLICRPPDRYWFDIRVNLIPINLKLTTGGTDNAFNKTAIIYSITGTEVEKRNMNYNQFLKTLKDLPKKPARNISTEYHYLVVNKDTKQTLLKSILDIHTYKSNPCNDLQINWTNEFNHLDYYIADSECKVKIQELLRTIQTSVRQAIAGMKEFSECNIEADFPK